MENNKTALNSLHKKYGAKLVSFAGYEMPIQYSDGIIEEHKYTRENAGIFDVSHMGQLFIKGDETLAKDLEKIFPTELNNAKLNQSKYSFLMNEEAGIHDDLIITKVEGGFNIVLNAACKHTDLKLLSTLLDNKYEMIFSSILTALGPCIAISDNSSLKIISYLLSNNVDKSFKSLCLQAAFKTILKPSSTLVIIKSS